MKLKTHNEMLITQNGICVIITALVIRFLYLFKIIGNSSTLLLYTILSIIFLLSLIKKEFLRKPVSTMLDYTCKDAVSIFAFILLTPILFKFMSENLLSDIIIIVFITNLILIILNAFIYTMWLKKWTHESYVHYFKLYNIISFYIYGLMSILELKKVQTPMIGFGYKKIASIILSNNLQNLSVFILFATIFNYIFFSRLLPKIRLFLNEHKELD